MLDRLNRLVSGAARRASLYQLGLLGPKSRAQVLEQAVEETISITEVPGGQILFFRACYYVALPREYRFIEGD